MSERDDAQLETSAPNMAVMTAGLDALGAALAATRSIRDGEAAGHALDANLVELRAIRRELDQAARIVR